MERTNYSEHIHDDNGIANLQLSINGELQPIPSSGMLNFTQNIQIMGKATKSVTHFRGSLSRVGDAQRWVGTYGNGIFDGAPFVAAFIHLRRFLHNAEDYGFASQVWQNSIQIC